MIEKYKLFKKKCERVCYASLFVSVCASVWLAVEGFCYAPFSLPAVVIAVSSYAVAAVTAWLGEVFK